MDFQKTTIQTPPTIPPELQNPAPKENTLKEIVKFTLIALAIVIPIRIFVAQPFIVSGASMDPTFKDKNYLIVDQLSYYFKEPARNDVVIFHYPLDPKTFYIKRVIGLPGETVKITQGKVTIINKDNPKGFEVPDAYVAPEHRFLDNYNVTLRPNEYFVMGDNRAESSDSRSWGPLERKYIVGRPFLRLFPFNKISVFPGKE
jgi:signal peptidase I